MKKLEKLRKVVYVVDMVNGFLKSGNMANPDAMRIVDDIIRLLNQTEKENEGIAFIRDAHSIDSSEFTKYPVHCLKESDESKVIDELKPFERDSISYEKNSTSVCALPEFFRDIDSMKNLEEMIFVGVCSDICVMNAAIPTANYLDQKNRVIKIRVPKNMIDTFDSDEHERCIYQEMSLKLMNQSGIRTENL